MNVAATASGTYYFTGFSGDLSGTTVPQNLTMSAARTVTASFAANPVTTLVTSPAGLQVVVDGSAYTTPANFSWTPGTSHTLRAFPQAGVTGVQYVSPSWVGQSYSWDGSSAGLAITTTTSAATYTAGFTTQFYLTLLCNPVNGGRINYPASGWFNAGSVQSVSVVAYGGFQFVGFSGGLSGTSTPQNLTIAGPTTVTASFTSVGRYGAVQTRTFEWSGQDLVKVTNPENGTVTYTYDGAHHVKTRVDANNHKTEYDYDAYGRVTEVRHYAWKNVNVGVWAYVEGEPGRWRYYYDTNPLASDFSEYAAGRLAAVEFSGFQYMYSYNQAGRVTKQRMYTSGVDPHNRPMDLIATYAWDNEGRMTSLGYPYGGSTFQYQYDADGRLGTMTRNGISPVSATYGAAGELTALTYDYYTETRQYNALGQLTSIKVPGMIDMTYVYPAAGQNNGRIAQSIDAITGEQVTYQYDMLNRLIKAETADNSWGEAYTYDGFGNLTAKTPTKGSAPALSVTYDPLTNWQTGVNYDASGNMKPSVNGYMPGYDTENRMVWEPPGNTYVYDPSGKRIFWTLPYIGNLRPWEYYFYGITGQKLAKVSCNQASADAEPECTLSENVYFGGKLIRAGGVTVMTDRLGSVRANSGGEKFSYFPYGEERTNTADSREKFGTYTRDGADFDYADQRYYSNRLARFYSPDPGGMSTADPANPASWNGYAYVQGDPVNLIDPQGLNAAAVWNPAYCDVSNPVCGPSLFNSNFSAESGGGGGGGNPFFCDAQCLIQAQLNVYMQTAGYQFPTYRPPLALSGNVDCESGVVRDVITGYAQGLGITLSGYSYDHVSVAGVTNGGADTMTEVYFTLGNDTAWNTLVSQLEAAGFVQAGYDPLHGDYNFSYRQMTADGKWSMQVSYDAYRNLQIDIDPHNPMQDLLGHAIDVIFNSFSGLDTNYHTAASNLGMTADQCK